MQQLIVGTCAPMPPVSNDSISADRAWLMPCLPRITPRAPGVIYADISRRPPVFALSIRPISCIVAGSAVWGSPSPRRAPPSHGYHWRCTFNGRFERRSHLNTGFLKFRSEDNWKILSGWLIFWQNYSPVAKYNSLLVKFNLPIIKYPQGILLRARKCNFIYSKHTAHSHIN